MFRALLIILMLAVAGCASSTSRISKDQQLIGRFIGDDGSYFIVTRDSKIRYHAIPAVWANANAKEEERVSGVGDWRLSKDTLVVRVRDQKGSTESSPTTRRIETFEVQGWYGLTLMVDTGRGSSYALYYVPPEHMKKEPNQAPEPTAGLRPSFFSSSRTPAAAHL